MLRGRTTLPSSNSQYQAIMNISSNRDSRDVHHLYPCLCQGEFCLTHGWSRDFPWAPDQEAPTQLLGFDEATNVGGVANSFDSALDLSQNVPTNDTYSGYGLAPENLFFTGFEGRHQNSEPENYDFWGGEEFQLNAEVEAPDTQSHPLCGTYLDYPADESSHNTNSSATESNPAHYQVASQGEILCNECSERFPHKSALDNHAKQTQHGAYVCNCGVTFTRLDVLGRHIQTFNRSKSYPCTYCSKFSGPEAFTRRDHLTQHLRGYHKIENSTESTTNPQLLDSAGNAKASSLSCPHEDCMYHQGAMSTQTPSSNARNAHVSLRSQKDFTKHMRDVHDESRYPCDVLGCDRVRGRGFCRKRDLVKHQEDYHVFPNSASQES
ncbi:hypothetical protein V8E51_013013 [Hyaloscypha variabilis]